MTTLPASSDATAASPDGTARGKLWTVGTLKYTSGGLVALFAILLWGDFAMSMKDRGIGVVITVMLKKFGASDLFFSLFCASFPAAVGMILGPIIAYNSDRHRGPWGRRIPFILIPLPFAVLSMVGLGFSPILGTHLHDLLGSHSPSLNICVLITFGFFWVIFDFASVIAGSVFNGLLNDVVPRAVIGRFFGLFRAVSLIAGILFFLGLGKYAATNYLEMFIGMAVLFGLGFGSVCLRLKEGEYPPPPPHGPHSGVRGFIHAAKGYFSECYGIPFYWWWFATGVFTTIAWMPVNNFNFFYALTLIPDYTQCLDFTCKCLGLTYAISLALTYPLGALADRVHPLLLALIFLFLYMLVTLLGGLYASNVRTFAIVLVAHGVVSGSYFTSTASLGFRMLPKANFVQFSTAGGLLISLSSIITPALIGGFLDYTHHAYRYIYFIGAAFSAIGWILLLVVYIKFLKMGGPKHYVPPDKIV